MGDPLLKSLGLDIESRRKTLMYGVVDDIAYSSYPGGLKQLVKEAKELLKSLPDDVIHYLHTKGFETGMKVMQGVKAAPFSYIEHIKMYKKGLKFIKPSREWDFFTYLAFIMIGYPVRKEKK